MMTAKKNDVPEYVKNSGAICEKLWTAADSLLVSSLELERALIERDTDRIWAILAEKEEKSSALNQAAQLWYQVYGEKLDDLSDELQKCRSEIKEKMQRFQIADKVNYSLTRNYLAVIDRSMVKAGAGLAGKKKVYNKGGRLGVKSSSMIFKSVG
ncbi:MAG: flagellar protein FlgN [Lentisphaerales bacterium]|nr:flagellar protein FlgN [Lentisphaerales bacterium]